jgi:hypothetical protein
VLLGASSAFFSLLHAINKTPAERSKKNFFILVALSKGLPWRFIIGEDIE